jgi:hypothetical protein
MIKRMLPRQSQKPSRILKPRTQNKPIKPKKGTPENPIRIVFVCHAGKVTSYRFAEAFKRYLEMNGLERIERVLDIQPAGIARAEGIERIKKADMVYSAFDEHVSPLPPKKILTVIGRPFHNRDLSKIFKRKFVKTIGLATTLRILDELPETPKAKEQKLREITRSISYFFDSVMLDLKKKYGIQ